MTLLDRLLHSAGLWTEATGRSLARLATLVMNDGNFFVRLGQPGATTTTTTLERFATFLTDAANWPDGDAPESVCSFAHAVGISGAACTASPDNLAQNIEFLPAGDAPASGPAGRTPSGEGTPSPAPGGKFLAPASAKAVA